MKIYLEFQNLEIFYGKLKRKAVSIQTVHTPASGSKTLI